MQPAKKVSSRWVRLQSAETKMTNSSMLAETNSEYRETVGVGVAARNRGDPESTPAGTGDKYM